MSVSTDVTARLAFVDQLMAALTQGPATTTEVAVRVGTVFCCCVVCAGRLRRAWPDDVYPVLADLARAGAVIGELGEDSEELVWRRVIRPAS